MAPGRAQAPQHRPAIDAGQVDVENHEVVIDVGRLMQPVEAVTHQIDDETRLGESLPDVFAGLRLVFDDQKAHPRLRGVPRR